MTYRVGTFGGVVPYIGAVRVLRKVLDYSARHIEQLGIALADDEHARPGGNDLQNDFPDFGNLSLVRGTWTVRMGMPRAAPLALESFTVRLEQLLKPIWCQ